MRGKGWGLRLAAWVVVAMAVCGCTRHEDEGGLDAVADTADQQVAPDGTVGPDKTGEPDGIPPKDNGQQPDGQPIEGATIKSLQMLDAGLNCAEGTAFIELQKGVELKGVVVTSPIYAASEKLDGFFMRDKEGGQYSGIKAVFDTGLFTDLAVGDVIDVAGDAKEYYCVTEFEVTTLNKVGHLDAVTPDLVDSAALPFDNAKTEPYEGCLVQLMNVAVAATDKYGGFTTDTGALVDNEIFGQMEIAGVGCKYASVVGPVDYSFSQYKILPRSADDLVLDTTTPCEVTPPPGQTVAEIQDSDTSNTCSGEAFVSGGSVSVKGLVITSPALDVSNGKYDGYYAFDGIGGKYSGIYLLFDANDNAQIQIGDTVDIEGEWTEFYCLTEIKVNAGGFTKAAPFGKEIPVLDVTPADLAPEKAEPYEGVLVRLTGVTVLSDPDQYGQFDVTGPVSVDDQFPITYEAKTGDKLASLTGVLTYSYSKYRILPRSDADIVKQ